MASLNVGIEVYAKTTAATGRSGGKANWAIGRERERRRADRQVEVKLIELRRVLGVLQGRIDDLDDLELGQLSGVVIDNDRVQVSELVLYLSTPSTLISSRSIAWQSSTLR